MTHLRPWLIVHVQPAWPAGENCVVQKDPQRVVARIHHRRREPLKANPARTAASPAHAFQLLSIVLLSRQKQTHGLFDWE